MTAPSLIDQSNMLLLEQGNMSELDKNLIVVTFQHVADEMRATNEAISRQADELHKLTTQLAVLQKSNSLLSDGFAANLTTLNSRVDSLEKTEAERKGMLVVLAAVFTALGTLASTFLSKLFH